MSSRLRDLACTSRHPLLMDDAAARDVLWWVADMANDKRGPVVYVAKRALADKIDRSEGQVRRAIDRLVAAQILTDTGKRWGRGQAVGYEINAGALEEHPAGGGDSRRFAATLSPDTRHFVAGLSPLKSDAVIIPSPSPSPSPTPQSPPDSPSPEGPPKQGAAGGDQDTHAADAAELVARYLDDDARPTDRHLSKAQRTRLEADLRARLAEGYRLEVIWRAWELLRGERSWRLPQRLGWMVGDGARIDDRYARAGVEPPDDIQHTGEVQELQAEPPDDLLESSLPPWGAWAKDILGGNDQ